MQTGIGFDAHKLVPGIDLMLGGVLIMTVIPIL